MQAEEPQAMNGNVSPLARTAPAATRPHSRRCQCSGARLRPRLRAITAAADANLAAVNYHFGSKEALFESVLTRRLDPMNQERVDLLTALEHVGSGPCLREDPVGDVRQR
jgi:hypothetical protein